MQTTTLPDPPGPDVTTPSGPAHTPADCPGICWITGDGRLARDTECPVHGIDANPHAWRTPDRYREGRFTDDMPEPPRVTVREIRHDEDREAQARRNLERYGYA